GQVVLDLQGAVELALLESPRYQSQLEELYLSALDVTFERFRFDTQFFGGSSIFFTADGKQRSGTGASSSLLNVSPSTPGNRLRAQKLTATGGQMAVGLANSLVWQFAGPDDYSSNTILDFSLFQPLLRAGGRGRVLERLTISERSLLANVRQMERFRRNFYVSIFSGRDPGQGPSRRGGFFGGSGLEGFSGVGGGGFGRVGGGGGGNFSGGNGGNTGGAGAQGAGGYLGLLQAAQVLRNQRSNVAALRDSVLQLQASNEAGRIDRFQVDLARQALFNAQSQLLSSENSFQSSLDSFKVALGLPPELNLQVNDPMINRLNLLDRDLETLQQQVADLLLELRQLRADQNQAENEQPLDGYLAKSAQIKNDSQQRLAAVQEDFRQLEAVLPQRREQLTRLASRTEVRAANIDPTLFSPELLVKRVDKRQTELKSLENQLAQTFEQLDHLFEPTQGSRQILDDLISTMSKLSGQLLELSLAQASARLDSINFSPVDLTSEQALAIASNYRRDWMNARANLVDSWRLIFFNANDLQSNLDLVFSGDLGNVGDNPFRFRDTRGRLRVGLEFDAPLTRLAERNVYRQSLIEYQQARRGYYQFRDRVYQGLRNTLRQIRLNEVNFELRRAAVQVAISQVDLTQLRLSEPPKPGETSQFGSTTARDLVQSLSDLLNVQNDFLSVWVNYEVQRLNLEVDLGVMELSPTGLRIENKIPLETYLANLTINSSDLGPIVTEKLLCERVELMHPTSVLPDQTPSGEEAEGIERLPALSEKIPDNIDLTKDLDEPIIKPSK
ncbi:MAG: TolC family protein, partial [Planctomycetes bacterium]|nr:TolC family protein [Planctomycetota bacterium]